MELKKFFFINLLVEITNNDYVTILKCSKIKEIGKSQFCFTQNNHTICAKKSNLVSFYNCHAELVSASYQLGVTTTF